MWLLNKTRHNLLASTLPRKFDKRLNLNTQWSFWLSNVIRSRKQKAAASIIQAVSTWDTYTRRDPGVGVGGVLSPSRNTRCGCLLTQMKHLSAFTSLVVQLLHMLTQLCRSRNTRLHSSPAVWYQTCGKGVAHLEQLVVLQGRLFFFF